MAALDSLCRMAADNAHLADFVVVYIEEAHPTDGWAFPGNHEISQHRTLEDRLAAAARLNDWSLPDNMTVVVDSMSDELNRAYGGLYDRLYVIHNGRVEYQGQRGPAGFRPGEVASWLRKYEDELNISSSSSSH